MKYLIFGDIHGKDLKKLEKTILVEKPDTLICLGDFDQVKSIREFMDIEKSLLNQGKKVIKVPGNHDYAVLNNLGINSGTMQLQGKTTYELHNDFKKDEKAREYLFKLVNSDLFARGFLNKEKYGKKYPFVVVHGGYGGKNGCYSCIDELKPMWYRMKDEEDITINFRELNKRDEKIMIRGHDHFPAFSTWINGHGNFEVPVRGSKFNIPEKGMTIITPGAYFYRDYAVIDASGKEPVIEYKKDANIKPLDF